MSWKITSNYLGDQEVFAIYRILRPEDVDHSGNREYLPVEVEGEAVVWVKDRGILERVLGAMNDQ